MVKSMNLQDSIKGDNGLPIASLNAQIGLDYGGLNISVHVIDKSNLESNKDLFRTKFETFIENIKTEAITNGWEALKTN